MDRLPCSKDKREMSNIDLARDALQELVACGVEEFVVCSGSRNSPFINVLINEPNLKKWWGFEERNSAFFALGRIRNTGRPVAIVTTSGTAVGELLPATMEAYYTSLPLVLLTADRPKRLRYTGAIQTCIQAEIFGPYSPLFKDIEAGEAVTLSEWGGRSPVHLNVCFEEPQKDKVPSRPLSYPQFKAKSWQGDSCFIELDLFLKNAEKLLVLVSTVREEARPAVAEFLENVGCDCYLEATSGLREKFESVEPELHHYTHVLRIGGVPTHRIWRDIQESKTIQVLSLSEHPFAGLIGPLVHTNLEMLPLIIGKKAKIQPPIMPPQGLYRDLSERIPKGSLVFLGNSMPIRDWDKYSVREPRDFDVQATRGLNGIDGQVSTFLGLCRPGRENWAIVGDLTMLYDLAAPWFLSQMEGIDLTVVVMNNKGGKIFEKMYPIPEMLNPHQLSFEPIAKMWGMHYELWSKIPDVITGKGFRLIEIAC